MLNALFTVLAILELALLHQCLPGPAQLAFPLFTAPSSISFLRRLAPRFSNTIRKRNSYVKQNIISNSTKFDLKKKFFSNNFKKSNFNKQSHPFYEFYLHQSQLSQNGFIHKVLPVLESSTLEIINSPYINNQFHHLINLQKAKHLNQNNHHHLLIHHPLQNYFTSNAFPHLNPKYYHHHFSSNYQQPVNDFSKNSLQLTNKVSIPSVNLPSVNQPSLTLTKNINQLTNYNQQNQQEINQQTILSNKRFLLLNNINSKLKEENEPLIKPNDEYSSTEHSLIESSPYQLNTEPLNQFEIDAVNVENFNLDDNNLEKITKIKNENFTLDFLTPTINSLLKNDANQFFKQLTTNQLQHYNNHEKNRSSDLNSKYSYNLIGDFNSSKYDFNQNIQVDFRERTAPDTSAGLFSRALGTLSNYLPNAMKITRTSGCVGGTKCQFFLSCWISSGSLGSSCGPLSTCCITPSKQDIQPAFYGPVINDPHCGRSAARISRIVGGTDASFGQFPWQAFVQVGGSRCGGALVGKKHVVTAGHCVARSQHNPSEIRVTLGDYILNSDIESLPHELFTVAEVRLHPNFRFTPQADRYDVAILVLDRVVQYRNNIKPICLPQKDANYLGRVAYVAGWGALQAGSKLRPKVLQHVNVPVIDNNVCEIWHRKRGINIKIHDEMVCAGFEGGSKDACQGDSGGPLMLNEYGVWYLIGIVSAGYSCAKQYQPGIYHRVSSSSDWVSANVYQNSN